MLEKFTVIDLVKTRSDSVVTIIGDGKALKFNRQTAVELHYPAYVQFLVLPKEKQFAIRACKKDAPNAVKFCKQEGEQKYQIQVTVPAVVDTIRKMAGWSAEEAWNIPGIYFAEDNGLVYSIDTAYKPSHRGGWAAKRKKDAAAAAAVENMEVVE